MHNNISNSNFSSNIVVLIPAAGNSSRMGKIKLLLPWEETTLLGLTINKVTKIKPKAITIVTGAYDKQLKTELEKFDVEKVYNANWSLGIGNSISKGVNFILQRFPNIDGILIILPDQPFVTINYLEKMVDKFINLNSIIATSYSENSIGVPVLFPKRFFNNLKNLNNDEGAKTLLNDYKTEVIVLDPNFNIVDIDTFDEYLKYNEFTS